MQNYQGVAVVTYNEREVPFTRIIEHKHFTFGKQEKTVISREYPSEWNIGVEPYYPVNDKENTELYNRYKSLAEQNSKVHFAGRLGQYKYLDMDKVISATLLLVQPFTLLRYSSFIGDVIFYGVIALLLEGTLRCRRLHTQFMHYINRVL